MYHYSQKQSGCKTGLNSSQAITMSVRPYPVLLKTSGMLQGKNPSSGLRFKHGNIAFTNTTHAIKTLWIAISKLQHVCHGTIMEPMSIDSLDR